MASAIVVKGARVHNLKNIDVAIPRDQLVVVTGVSGSGKTSLAFDTLFAEGQRRYLESLATDTRQFLQQLDKPDVDSITGLSPAIAIEQQGGRPNPRSTVGTITDIYDVLRLFFARVGQAHCPRCGRPITVHSIEAIVDRLCSLPERSRLWILAPLSMPVKNKVPKFISELQRQGFTRVKLRNEIVDLSDLADGVTEWAEPCDLLIDRLAIRDGVAKRITDSLETATKIDPRLVKVEVQKPDNEHPEVHQFSRRFACIVCDLAFPEVTPKLFSFNSPEGACAMCHGLGKSVDRETGAVAEELGGGCHACKGSRLGEASRAVTVDGASIVEISSWPLTRCLGFFDQWAANNPQSVPGQKLSAEITTQLKLLTELGVGYLALNRGSTTLSSGEMQRLRLATQLGSSMAGVLYILDEPSIGLHQKDNQRLIELLQALRDAGNTVLVVEHDPETIMASDHVIDLGPGAGVNGGTVIALGTPAALCDNQQSLTGKYLSGKTTIPIPLQRRSRGGTVTIGAASLHNLKNITVEIPIGTMTCVTGVSGAGKSSLVMGLLYDGVASHLTRRAQSRSQPFGKITGWEQFDRVIGIDQAPIGKTPRANPATYVGFYDPIRRLFAQLPEARVRGYQAARFSFNTQGGRCEHCHGDGSRRVAMHFLPDVEVICDACHGARYTRETLEVKYKGLSIADVLALTVAEAAELFSGIADIHRRLLTLCEVGLCYLSLGQPASTLSGGESQRVKLARELSRKSSGRSLYVLDEPTTGLHFDDVRKLLELLHRLTDLGNTMVIIEHNLDVIKNADHVIDLGPGGGDEGGRIVGTGTPEAIAGIPESFTGQFLARVLPR